MKAGQKKRSLITVFIFLASSFAFYASASASPTWTVPAIHAPTGSPDNDLNISGLNCISKNFCVASGQYQYQDPATKNLNPFANFGAFVSIYNGTSWTSTEIAHELNVGGNGSVSGVTCVSNSFCVASGVFTPSVFTGSGVFPGYRPFVSIYNGTSWTSTAIAKSLTINSGYVSSPSCVSIDFCTVGGYGNPGGAFVSIYNGTIWSDQVINSSASASVQGISCISKTFCAASGVSGGGTSAFVSIYNGSGWTTTNVGAGVSNGWNINPWNLSCINSEFCVLGGTYQVTSNAPLQTHAFVSIYNGKTWTDEGITLELDVGIGGSLDTISCTSVSFCVAGGRYSDNTKRHHAFVSIYNGKTWTSSNPTNQIAGEFEGNVQSVSCTSESFCMAAGGTDTGKAFVSLYNGKIWSTAVLDQTIAINTGGSWIDGLSCISNEFCAISGVSAAPNSQGDPPTFTAMYSDIALKATTTSTIRKPVTTTINCYKGKLLKKVTDVKPVCPAGYAKK